MINYDVGVVNLEVQTPKNFGVHIEIMVALIQRSIGVVKEMENYVEPIVV